MTAGVPRSAEPATPMLSFTVYGKAAPAGSKVARTNASGRSWVHDSSKRAAPWKDQVGLAAFEAMLDLAAPEPAELMDGPLGVKFFFYVARPKGHYGKNGLRPSAPAYPTVRPDVLKLARAVEDACTGIVWRDDAQIVIELLRKYYGEPARVEVIVWRA